MKVTRVETRPVVVTLPKPIGSALGRHPRFRLHLVFVHCDNGVVGENLVFTLNNRRTKVLRAMVDELADSSSAAMPARSPISGARAWKDINFLGHKGVPVVGISALDGALWDAYGKSLGQPLYRMLGGARTEIPAYHSGGLWLSYSDAELVEEAERFVAEGFRAMKMRLGSADPDADIARVRAGPQDHRPEHPADGRRQSGADRIPGDPARPRGWRSST